MAETDRLKEMIEKASALLAHPELTTGPWDPCLSALLCHFTDEAEPRVWRWHTNGEFIALARELVPLLIARVRELEAALSTQQSKSCNVCGKKVWLHQAGACQCGNEVYG